MRLLISFFLLLGLCFAALPNEASARERHRRLWFSSQPPIFLLPPPPAFLYESPEGYDPYVEMYEEPDDPPPPRQKQKIKKQQKKTSVKKSRSDARALSKAAPAPASPAVSCGKAEDIVRDFGFQSVAPSSCSGKIYAFKAIRDGKAYSVKLDSGNGELTEVKKQP